MDSQHTPQDEHQQKDFFTTLFDDNVHRGHEGHQQGMYGSPMATTPQPPPMNGSTQLIPSIPLNFDFLNGIMNAQQQQQQQQSQQQQHFNPQVALEQRLKLNQLQQLQLQNQILQQQASDLALNLELLNGQGSMPGMDGSSDRQKGNANYLGLPTPMPSTELHPQASPSTDYVSPMALNYIDNSQFRGESSHGTLSQTDMAMHHLPHPAHSTHSAPANLVFNTNPPVPLPSPGHDMEFDLSPLTSPWMDAYKQDQPPPRQNVNNKRTASPIEEEHARAARTRPSPAMRATQPPAPPNRRQSRGSKSASSTPLMRSTRSGTRQGSAGGDVPGDTPSPVDLSMPPPAPPMHSTEMSNAGSSTHAPSTSTAPYQNMTPVTPASIMNLGRLGINSSLAPPTSTKSDGKPKGSRRDSTARKPAGGSSLISPSLKPILPAGGMTGPTTSSLPSPILRKTSHKAAEQKRRDSLKTTFDDLRTLLPPIPLPSEDGFPDEPLLPGAMPPRGPPRGNADGPNRSISKLQLLRCGNEYLRLLKGRIERRDREVGMLRAEVARLRGLLPEDAWAGADGGALDLERDLDVGEIGPWKRSGSAYDGDEGDEDGGES